MRLLLDAHIGHAVLTQIRRRGADVESLARWRDGALRSADDEVILLEAAQDDRILVSFDCRTLPARLRRWAAEGRGHAGVVLIDDQTIRPDDTGGLVRALMTLLQEHGQEDWHDQVIYLTRS